MPLIFSPLAEDIIDKPPRSLYPRTAFVMRQIGSPPDLDQRLHQFILTELRLNGIGAIDATTTTVRKDYLERILGLIRGTAFTIAIFSEQTRAGALANIALELGFAAMCGKPLMIIKSKEAVAPSDLKRTDWIECAPDHPEEFSGLIRSAIGELDALANWEFDLLQTALEARQMDCAIAFERANKGFLLSGDMRFVQAAHRIRDLLAGCLPIEGTSDLDRVKGEIDTFIAQAGRVGQIG